MFGIKRHSDKNPAETPQASSSEEIGQGQVDDIVLTASASGEDAAVSVEQPATEVPAPQVDSTPVSSAASRFFKQAPAPILKPSIISEGFDLQGDIKSTGGLHVEGRVDGRIDVDNLTIGAKGAVRGIVKCAALNIKGTFDGEAVCDSLSLSGTAVVNGDIAYNTLTMSSGTVLTGRLKKT